MTADAAFQRTHASLALRGPGLSPAFWTRHFQVKPERWARKGELISFAGGRKARRTISRNGVWVFALHHMTASLDIGENVEKLLDALRLPDPDFVRLLKERGEVAEVWVFVEDLDGTNPPTVTETTKHLVEACGAKLVIDHHR